MKEFVIDKLVSIYDFYFVYFRVYVLMVDFEFLINFYCVFDGYIYKLKIGKLNY